MSWSALPRTSPHRRDRDLQLTVSSVTVSSVGLRVTTSRDCPRPMLRVLLLGGAVARAAVSSAQQGPLRNDEDAPPPPVPTHCLQLADSWCSNLTLSTCPVARGGAPRAPGGVRRVSEGRDGTGMAMLRPGLPRCEP